MTNVYPIMLEVSFPLGGVVYLRANSEKVKGIVVSYVVQSLEGPGHTLYTVSWPNNQYATHLASELTEEYIGSDIVP